MKQRIHAFKLEVLRLLGRSQFCRLEKSDLTCYQECSNEESQGGASVSGSVGHRLCQQLWLWDSPKHLHFSLLGDYPEVLFTVVLEKWANSGQFPSCRAVGSFRGGWWQWVAMPCPGLKTFIFPSCFPSFPTVLAVLAVFLLEVSTSTDAVGNDKKH